MITREDYTKAHSKIIANGDGYDVFIDGECVGTYDDKLEAEDSVYDTMTEFLQEDHKYECGFCSAFFNEDGVEHRHEEYSFTAPYGETIVWGGDNDTVAVCPICKRDLEEI